MIKTSERKQMCPSQVSWQENCGFAGIDFILPADEDEWLCTPGRKGPAEPSTLRGSPGACTHLCSGAHLGQPRRCLGVGIRGG